MTRSSGTPCYRVAQSANGERRLVATRTIESAELVISEVPVVLAPISLAPSYRAWSMVRSVLTQPEKLRWLSSAKFKRTRQPWDAEDAKIAHAIARSFGVEQHLVRDLYLQVATNHMGFFDETGQVAGSGLFETLCFSNHSCAPNTVPVSPESHSRGTALRAIKEISGGAEITWNYTWPNDITSLSYKQRQRLIYKEFRFRCRCLRCSGSP